MILALVAAAALQPQAILTIDPKHRLVEGVATDGATIFVSSVLDRQILSCTARACRTIATLPAGLHPLGIAWDWGRGLLWIAADCPDVAGIAKCERGALVAINRDGKLRVRVAPAQAPFHPGDVSATQSGIFVSDSQNGRIWALMPRRPGLRPVNRAGDGKSAQGTALTPAGTELVIADYSQGIGRIDLRTGATNWLPHQEGRPLRGIDGLVRCGDHYLGVYNGGVIPPRIWSFQLRSGGIDRSELAEGMPLTDPTQIAYDGKRLLVVSDSGWDRIAKGDTTRRSGAQILAIPLPRGCRPS